VVSRGASILGPLLGLLFVVGLFALLVAWQDGSPQRFLSTGNFKLMMVHASVTAIVALGMTIIMISGGIDLSVGYVVSLVTVTTMLAFRACTASGWPDVLASVCAISCGLATGMVVGLLNGCLITGLRIAPFVVTLGMMGVARGLAQFLTRGTPIAFPDPAHPPGWVPWLATIEPQPSWLLMGPGTWLALLLALIVALLLHRTVLGRHAYAIGSNEATARLCGINVGRTKIVLYSSAGLLTGAGGILQFARSGAGLHDVQAGLELEVIAAVVIGGGSLSGGEGRVLGTLVGALLITVLGNGCSKLGMPMEFRYVVIGCIIVLVAALNRWRSSDTAS
jgi:ribose transport system permease protein